MGCFDSPQVVPTTTYRVDMICAEACWVWVFEVWVYPVSAEVAGVAVALELFAFAPVCAVPRPAHSLPL
jgi:hypothetical protein